MKLIGMMPARNEAWCLGLSLRVALKWCDEVVVLLHACTDASEDIVLGIEKEYGPERVYRMKDDGQVWTEMRHRAIMLDAARYRGATHLAIIDADEVLTGNLACPDPGTQSVRMDVRDMAPGSILQLPGYNLRDPYAVGRYGETFRPKNVGLHHYHSNGVWGSRWFSVAFADDPRLSWSGDTFHKREPQGIALKPYRPIQQGQGGVLHLWGASERRLIAKHALYKVTENIRRMRDDTWIDYDYSLSVKGDPKLSAYGTPETWTYSHVPESWWAPYSHLMKYLDVDAEPWQEAEVRRLVAERGREMFAGLDLFGVA